METLTLSTLDYVGVFVFAVSGAMTAVRKEMDLFGCVVLALMPAVGGGTIRDLVLDVPVFWIVDNRYLLITLCAAVVTAVAYHWVLRAQRVVIWSDAVGLAVFSVLGAAKAWEVTGKPIIAVMMGVVTAVAGGIVRDVIANDVPLVLQREIYATAAFGGALVYVAAVQFAVPGALWAGIGLAFALRSAGIYWHWSLPRVRGAASG
ncbi:MAG: trimeric intracellular cation channel family protein [Pseudomonadota bacterium]